MTVAAFKMLKFNLFIYLNLPICVLVAVAILALYGRYIILVYSCLDVDTETLKKKLGNIRNIETLQFSNRYIVIELL